MKVITIKQPYASMIVNNYKRYEFRSWKTNYRGKLLIHAGNSVNKDDLIYYNYLDIKEYPKMKIIGECELTDCILIDDNFDKELRKNKIYGRHSRIGLYAWKLDNIKMYDKYIDVKGKLGLWNYGDTNGKEK